MKFVYEAPSKFSQTGYIIGKLIPRSSDSNPLIRKSSLHCIDLVLSIASKFESHFDGNESLEDMHLKFQKIEQTIETDDQKVFAFFNNIFCEIIWETICLYNTQHVSHYANSFSTLCTLVQGQIYEKNTFLCSCSSFCRLKNKIIRLDKSGNLHQAR